MGNKYKYYFMLVWAILLGISVVHAQPVSNNGSRYAATSKLAEGKWIKLKLSSNDPRRTDNAIYKLTYDDIKKMGISDPAKVKIYGAGGWILDEDFSKPYVDDLQEIAVWVNKGQDGIFNSGDYLLFYGKGTTKWRYNSGIFEHENNPYSTYAAYFMTESDSGPKEVETLNSVDQTSTTFTEYNDYLIHERDSISIANTGRELFGESFATKSTQAFDFSVPGITSATVSLSFAANPTSYNTPLSLTMNDQSMLQTTINPSMDSYTKATLVNMTSQWTNLSSEAVSIKVTFPSGSQTAYLNYIRLNVTRKLQPYGNYTFFRSAASKNVSARYNIDNASASNVVFDLTDPYNVKKVNATLTGNQLSFGVQSGSDIHEFALIDLNKSFPTPESMGVVANQNLHGLDQTDMVIIAPKVFLSQAETLANAHRNQGLRVTVVQSDLIFNEFSSGIQDATAYRRFMKMFYDRATSASDKPKYLLLFGDGIFDNRFLTPPCSGLNKDYYLTTYQVKESVNENNSFGTEDYFGLLDDNEGVYINSDGIDLGIGRFPVSSVEQANNAINKVLGYMANMQNGSWKNSITFVADDTDAKDSYCLHAQGADRVASYMQDSVPGYLLTKIYEDAFNPMTVNGMKAYPDAKSKLMSSLKEGTFLLNYTGHGSTTDWTSEKLMTTSDVNQMLFTNLPLWITATCDFGWFDGVSNSGGEAAFQNKKSGAIALFTTTRVVNSDGNEALNKRLMYNLFSKKDSNGRHLLLGDVLRTSKNELGSDANKLNYVLLGDPALQLNYPDYQIVLDSINGISVKDNTGKDASTFKFKAMDQITITGHIADMQGNLQSGFNGAIHTEVYDGQQLMKVVKADAQGNYFTFTDYPSMIYPGNNTVKNGIFKDKFNVPIDISYSDNPGKMNFYASDTTNKQDAQGYFSNYILNGSSVTPDGTGEGPQIKAMYLNTTLFKNGDQVNETPYFVAEVYDEDGINISGGSLGHEISICIDKNPNYTYSLNDYFEAGSEIYGEGIVKYSIPTLPEGNHTLVFKVWDLLNNSSVDSLTFTVVNGLRPHLYDLIATTNPAKISTSFLLLHDRPETQLNVEIKVYNLMGQALWTHVETGSSEWLKYYTVDWNLSADNGMRLSPGVYIYQAIVSDGKSKEATKAKKIIIQGQ